MKSNTNQMRSREKNSVFTKVALTPDGDTLGEDDGRAAAAAHRLARQASDAGFGEYCETFQDRVSKEPNHELEELEQRPESARS